MSKELMGKEALELSDFDPRGTKLDPRTWFESGGPQGGNDDAERNYEPTPFGTNQSGNTFRRWVINNYPDFASKNELDPKGDRDNWYIRKAWEEFGVEFKAEFNQAHQDIILFNKQLVDSYAPGTANADRLMPYVQSAPGHLNLLGDVLRVVSEGFVTPEEKYERFYNDVFKKLMYIKVPANMAINSSGDPLDSRHAGEGGLLQSGNINFRWDPAAIDEHGYRGSCRCLSSRPGSWLMTIDPNYWMRESSQRRQRLLWHELEHAVSTVVGMTQKLTPIVERGDARFEEDAANLGGDDDYQTPEFENYRGPIASNMESQLEYYENVFSEDNIPDWYTRLKRKEDRGHTDVVNYPEFYNEEEGFRPGMEIWAGRREEQRAVLKTFLQDHGGKMTRSLLKHLCKEKARAAAYDWENTSAWKQSKFIRTFTENGFRIETLLYLDCEADEDLLLNNMDSIVQNAPLERGSQDGDRLASNVKDKLTKVSLYLKSIGLKEEAGSVDNMAKHPATHNR